MLQASVSDALSCSPSLAIPVDTGHPLARGLVFFCYMVGGVWYDAVSGQTTPHPGTLRGRAAVDGNAGVSLSGIGAGAAGGQFANQTGLDRIAGPFSLFVEGSLEVNATNSSLVRSFEASNGDGFGINLDDVDLVVNSVLYWCNNGNRGSSSSNSLGSNSENFTHRVMVAHDGATVYRYLKGSLNNSGASAFVPNANAARRTTMVGTNGTQSSASVALVAAWAPRVLTLEEYRELYYNPWQILSGGAYLSLIAPAGGGPFALAATAPIALQGTISISADLAFEANIPIEALGPIALQGTLGIQADIVFEIKRWRVPTNAAEGTPVHMIVFTGAGPTYAILAQGDATIEADGSAHIPASGTIGAKAFAVVHNYDDDTETTSIFGGPCIATIVDVG